MRKPQGYAQIIGPGLDNVRDPGLAGLQRDKECDTYTCGHCQCVTHVPAQIDPADCGALCLLCDTLICKHCAKLGVCAPFYEKLEEGLRKEERARFLRG